MLKPWDTLLLNHLWFTHSFAHLSRFWFTGLANICWVPVKHLEMTSIMIWRATDWTELSWAVLSLIWRLTFVVLQLFLSSAFESSFCAPFIYVIQPHYALSSHSSFPLNHQPSSPAFHWTLNPRPSLRYYRKTRAVVSPLPSRWNYQPCSEQEDEAQHSWKNEDDTFLPAKK